MARKRSAGPSDKRPRAGRAKSSKQAAPTALADDADGELELTSAEPRLPFAIVGIGASAGGLESTSALLKALPAESGIAFVVVHHLAPGRVSMLPEILGRATKMPVVTAANGMDVQPNMVYVIAPGAGLELEQGKLRVTPRERADGGYRPVDLLFRSLAREQHHRAIGVILSGTANDGTVGCEEIKAAGGITFAQDATAQESGMPQSAVAAGCVDFVQSPEAIAHSIASIAANPLADFRPDEPPVNVDHLAGVVEQIRAGTGVDFTHYKRATLVRRITRRMVMHKLTEVGEYEALLASTPAEVEALFQDILINVTSFFRNPEAFELLKDRVFPALLAERTRKTPIRIWVLGCSTGEEAYSLAIAITEYMSAENPVMPVQIFASDLSNAGIIKARAGFYPKAIEQEVSQDRLRRFFIDTDGGYRVTKSIRDMVVFARHNALVDPPFSHVDLISCRNLLIYLDSVLQQRLVPILHYALNPSAYLWLGPSETIGPFRAMFELIDARHKLYQRKPAAPLLDGFTRREHLAGTRGPVATHEIAPRVAADPVAINDPQREADRLLLSRYVPAGVLINGDFEMMQFRGETAPYLTPSPGRASLNLLKMLREGLVVGVRAAVLRAKREQRPVRHEAVRIHSDGEPRMVTVEVIPIRAGNARDTCYMVVFDDARSATDRARPTPATKTPRAPRGARATVEIQRLHQELAASREYLQSVIEQQEAAYEELQSANEEVQSTNEELQSINEELETSKEEIQSSSEELATVNDELHHRNQELTDSHNDLSNLIASTQIPIVMLGADLRIRRFTPSAERLLNLITTDVGRPITDLKSNIEIPDLQERLAVVMETVSPQEVAVQDRTGRWYLLRLRPYRTGDNKIDGVVVSFVDIESLKRAESELSATVNRLAILQDDAPLGIRETDAAGRITRVNNAYCQITGYRRNELLGKSFLEFLVPEDRDRAESFWRSAMNGETNRYRDEQRTVTHDGTEIWIEVNGSALVNEDGSRTISVAFVQDITSRKRAEQEAVAADRAKNEFLATLAHELRNPLAPLLNVTQLLADRTLSDDRFAEFHGILERQIRNLGRMTDDLVDIARISQGRLQLKREAVDLVTLVRRATDLFRPALERRSQQFTVTISDRSLPVIADPVRIEQIIDNLLTNASKFTPGGGAIRVTLARSADSSSFAELRVADTGIGIAPAFLPVVFDPFTQADKTLDRKRGGLGIGLTLVRRLVEAQDGSVTVRSAGIGKGAEFVVRLPIASLSISPADVVVVDDLRTARPLQVLIADDNRDGAETMAMLLRRVGHDVVTAADGVTAVEQIVSRQPDVVLLDIGLPGKNGFEVAREVRQRGGAKRVTLVALTGYGQEQDRQNAQAAGIDHYFTKPVDIEPLLQLLQSLPS